MEVYLLAIQARVLLFTGLAYLVVGIWLGTDPLVLAWRAPLAAFAAMLASRWLLRQVAAVIGERAAADMAERQLATEQAALATAAATAKAGPPGMQAVHAAQARFAKPGAG